MESQTLLIRSCKHFILNIFHGITEYGENSGSAGGTPFPRSKRTWGITEAERDAHWLVCRYPGCADHVGA